MTADENDSEVKTEKGDGKEKAANTPNKQKGKGSKSGASPNVWWGRDEKIMTEIRNLTEWHCKTELEAQTVLLHCQRTLKAVTPATNQQVKPEANLLTTR